MRRGIIVTLGRARRWLAQAVALVLVLPVLLSALPQPALSAAAALESDVMLSLCAGDGPQQGDHDGTHANGHDHCVLCGAACAGAGPSLANATPAFAAPPRRSGTPADRAAGALAPPLQARLDAVPPRGPPVLS